MQKFEKTWKNKYKFGVAEGSKAVQARQYFVAPKIENEVFS